MALYNGGFPATYQPMYQYVPQQQTQQQSQQGGKIWVIGEAGAKSYLVAPNSTVDLWDSEAPVIYLKSADASGMPSMKILDYTVRQSNANSPVLPSTPVDNNSINYATKAEIEGIEKEIAALRNRMDKITRKMVDEDE